MSPTDIADFLARSAGLEVAGVAELGTESRNSVWRVSLVGGASAILKLYDPALDPHAANRFRREEKVLTLLSGCDSPVAPKPLSGLLPAGGSAALLMEDAGSQSLADTLMKVSTQSSEAALRLWSEAAVFLSRLHEEMDRLDGPLRRTAHAISLDEINTDVLLARFNIASRRLMDREPSADTLAAYAGLVQPMFRDTAPDSRPPTPGSFPQMIHNSMSPLNVVPSEAGWRAVDWETLTAAPRVFDWAEMLRAPYAPLAWSAAEDTAVAALGGGDRQRDLYRRATFSRHLDSLATVTLRRRRYTAEGRSERAAEYARRAAFYVDDISYLLAELQPGEPLTDWVRMTTESASL